MVIFVIITVIIAYCPFLAVSGYHQQLETYDESVSFNVLAVAVALLTTVNYMQLMIRKNYGEP